MKLKKTFKNKKLFANELNQFFESMGTLKFGTGPDKWTVKGEDELNILVVTFIYRHKQTIEYVSYESFRQYLVKKRIRSSDVNLVDLIEGYTKDIRAQSIKGNKR